MVPISPRPWRDVPSDVAPALRDRIPPLVNEIIAAVRSEVPEYDRPLEGGFGRFISAGVRLALEQFVDLLGTGGGHPDASAYETMGRAELEAGRTLDALQSAYRIGARVAWRRIVVDFGDRFGPDVMYPLAEAIFAYIDRLADASVAGYSDALAAREGSAQARRQALVELLLAGPVTADALAEPARLAQWTRLPRIVLIVACDHDDPAALARQAPDATLAARTDEAAWLVVPDPDGPGRAQLLASALADVPCAIGSTVPLERAHVSADRASRALAMRRAGEFAATGPVRADDHRVALLLAADRDLAAELANANLGPLARLTPTARDRAEATLTAWLDAHGDVSLAARALHVHPQTIRYRLANLRKLLGDDALDDPSHRLELALALLFTPGASGASA